MARKWRAFFGAVQSILNRSGKFILLGVLAIALALNLHGVSPAIAREPSLNLKCDSVSTDLVLDEERLNSGICFYKNGKFAEAETAFQEAAQFLSGDVKALALNYIALAQLRQSEFERAEITLQESLRLLNHEQNLGNSVHKQKVYARILTTSGRLKLAQNQPDAALESLAKATKIYEELGDTKGKLGSQINEAQAMQQLGFYREALQSLVDLEEEIKTHRDPEIRLRGILTLGKTYRAIGALEKSYCLLNTEDENSEVLLELGNTAQAIGKRLEDQLGSLMEATSDPLFPQNSKCDPKLDSTPLNWYKHASTSYQEALDLTRSNSTKVQTMLNKLSLALYLKQYPELEKPEEYETKELWQKIVELLEELPLNRMKVYDRIKLARNLTQLYPNPNAVETAIIENLFETALQEAQELQDKRAEAYAIGDRGWMYEQQQQWQEAETWTRKAMEIPLPYATDIAYQWEWQLGRILNAEGRKEEAIAHYTEAVDLLQKVRQNLVAIAEGIDGVTADLQFDFRDRVEPVYRQLVGLLLESNDDDAQEQDNIQTALGAIELLQVAELENFLQCDLPQRQQVKLAQTVQEAKEKVVEKLAEIHSKDPTAAVIYPIILDDRLEVIRSLPNEQNFRRHIASIPQEKMFFEIQNTNYNLRYYRSYEPAQTSSRKFYEWLIKPLEKNLPQNSTLVFVLDVYLQQIPIAALNYAPRYDQYLVIKYPSAIVPSLQLLNLDTSPNNEASRALLAGVTKGRKNVKGINFPPLPNVGDELGYIEEVFNSPPFFDEEFTKNAVFSQFQTFEYPIIHLATHGNFSSQREFTFILDGEDIINLDDFNRLLGTTSIREGNLSLLVMSACKTATGDNRATLGMAGVALQAGAKSTIASLWAVSDPSTAELMKEFYKQFVQPQEANELRITKAEALRRAEEYLLLGKSQEYGDRFEHPRYWAPFVLIGNWL